MADADVIDLEDTSDALFVFIVVRQQSFIPAIPHIASTCKRLFMWDQWFCCPLLQETQERSLRLSARSKEDKDIWMNHLRAHKLMSNTFEPDPEEKELTPSRIARKFSIHTIKFSDFGAEYLTDTNKPNAKNAATMDNWITKMKVGPGYG